MDFNCDIIEIVEAWREPGDEKYIWAASSDEYEDRIYITTLNSNLTFPAINLVKLKSVRFKQSLNDFLGMAAMMKVK